MLCSYSSIRWALDSARWSLVWDAITAGTDLGFGNAMPRIALGEVLTAVVVDVDHFAPGSTLHDALAHDGPTGLAAVYEAARIVPSSCVQVVTVEQGPDAIDRIALSRLRKILLSKKSDPNQLLLELARTEGPDVIHLAYSPEFEALCRQINPNSTTQEKHALWEKLLVLGNTTEQAEPGVTSERQSPPPYTTSVHPMVSVQPIHKSLPQMATSPAASGLLFPVDPPVPELQPWTTPAEPELEQELAHQRAALLASIAHSQLATYEQRVARILHRYPDTRDSDTALCLRYWRTFQADVIERWKPLELEILFDLVKVTTLVRTRQIIQNDLRLFRGMEDTQKAREAMQRELHEYLASHRDTLPEIRFYLDETGNEGDKNYTGVAGVCIINWKQYAKHHAALEQWREKQGWPETIHFAETGADKVDRAASLLQQLAQRRSGVLFLGYSIASRGRTQEAMFSLFIQLVVDSLKHLQQLGCLSENRNVRVIKEADPGFDSIYLDTMTKRLSEAVALEFPGLLAVSPVEAVTKGRTVVLECADLIAGGMQRRALGKGRNPKDKLAEAVINVTGFEDGSDTGALFKFFAPSR